MGLDAHEDVRRPQKAVSMDDRMSKMEKEVGSIDSKLDLLLNVMKKGNSREQVKLEDDQKKSQELGRK